MKNYSFDGSISLEVLNNYLNRAMTFSTLCSNSEEVFEIHKQMLLDVGIKHVARAGGFWTEIEYEAKHYNHIKKNIDALHAADPDIILEACIFEIVNARANEIKIFEETFKAFGEAVEDRTFDVNKMVFPDGYGLNQWGNGQHIPDITQRETQMYFYQRACVFIDLGYEALHLGQTNLIGKNDENLECWTKVIHLIRAYAGKNARRHYVLINCHFPTHNFVGTDGVMLVDFTSFPLCLYVKSGQKDHMASEDNPQECDIHPNTGGEVYNKHIHGISPSGFETNDYPYLVEFDNYGVKPADFGKAVHRWGYDEICWWGHQPQWYRQQFVEYIIKRIDSFKENGHLALPGCRWMAKLPNSDKGADYYCNDPQKFAAGWGEEAFYKELLKKLDR